MRIHYINLFLLLLALSFHLNIKIRIPDIEDDIFMQLAATRSFIDGKGMTYNLADTKDLSKYTSKWIDFWPPGYTILAAPILIVTKDALLTDLILKCSALIMLFCSVYLLFRLFSKETEPYANTVFYIFVSVSILPFKYINTTDLLCLALFSLSVFVSLRLITTGSNYSKLNYFFQLLLISFLSFLTCFLRFAYYPLAMFFPLFFLLIALFFDRKLIKSSIFLLLLVSVLVAGQMIYQNLYVSSGNYLSERHAGPEQNLHWDNLGKFDYVFLKSFFTNQVFPVFFEYALNLLIGLVLIALISTFLLRLSARFPYQLIFTKKPVPLFILLVTSATLLNISFLTYLSLKYPYVPENAFTYVGDIRYYAVNVFFVPVIILLIVFSRECRVHKLIKAFIVLFFLTSAVLMYGKSVLVHSFEKNPIRDNSHLQYFRNSIQVFQKLSQSSSRKAILATDDIHDFWKEFHLPIVSYAMYGSIAGMEICSLKDLLQAELKSSKPVDIYIVVFEPKKFPLQEFYKKYKAKEVIKLLNSDPVMLIQI